MARFPSFIVGVPSAGLWKAEMGVSLCNMIARTTAAQVVAEVCGVQGCYVEKNRNTIVRLALESPTPVDGILWVDTDMEFPPDTLLRLMARQKHIVGCNYRERAAPHGYLGHFLDDDDRRCYRGGLHKMDRMPGGLMLVGMSVYHTLSPPWYRAPIEENDPRDDYYFSLKAREAGFGVWCDMDLTRHVVHRGEQAVGWFRDDEPVLRRGAAERPGATAIAVKAA